MPSPDDIPERLLGRENWAGFVAWVQLHFFRKSERKTYGRFWSKLSKVPLTAEMWDELVQESRPDLDL